jgi:ligand-binding sensor domain-containing protein/signal transduction histidine kinase
LNFCRKNQLNRNRSLICLLAVFAVACAVSSIYALDPNRGLIQFPRDRWGMETGFPGGTIYAITQSADGYLWLGTEKGLVRFDGFNFQLIQHSDTPALPAGPILGLIADADGNLWIRLQSPSIVRYRNGKFEDVLTSLERIEPRITSMNLGKDNKILLSTFENGILRYNGEKFVTLASKAETPDSIIISIAETENGDIWMGTRDAGLNRLSEQKFSAITEGLPDQKINCLLPVGIGELLIGTDKGLVRWNGSRLTKSGLPEMLNQIQILTMLKDRDANIWIGTDKLGLLRLSSDGITSLDKLNQTGNGAITALFEDREGNLWTGNDEGIERFRNCAFVTYSASDGLPSEKNGAIFADPENRIWFAPLEGGLFWLNGNQVKNIAVDGLAEDIVYSIAGGRDDLWIGRQRGGLTHLRFTGNSLNAKTYTQKDGLAQNSVYAVYQSRDGAVWAGTLSGGVSRLKNGEFTTYTIANGLAANAVTSITETADAAMWFATPSGLNVLSNGNWRMFAMKDGLPSENIVSLLRDSSDILWIGTVKGLAFLDSSGQIRNIPENLAPLRESILGLTEDKNGFLWVATANHVLRVNREKLLNDSASEADIREFGLPDGLESIEGVKRSRSVGTDAAGRVWFSLGRGISMVDVSRLKIDSVPALVQIQRVAADGTAVELQDDLRIPSVRQRITFKFAGLSLSIPERVKFRYMLEGFDQGWSEPTYMREADYTNLSPGLYSFRVIASNSDGVWNSQPAIIRFEIAPMFWQTWWFRVVCLIVLALGIIGLYRLRLHRVTRRMNVRFEERLAERTRIAQELHDSLLQGFVSVSMQLNVAVDNVPADSPSKRQLSRILELMGQVTDEGRHTLRGLRSSQNDDAGNLEQSFADIRQDFTAQKQAEVRVIVEGSPRVLRAITRDEVYHIGREALLNAYRHSKAKQIEIIVEYNPKSLRVLVRDDGCGIDQDVLQAGRDGHWGLIGMRERAEKIGARLKVLSRVGGGTEVELFVPQHIAFEKQTAGRRFGWIFKSFTLNKEKNK